jgi:Bacteriophage Mu, Gp27
MLRPKVYMLPKRLREALEKKLLDGAFTGYRALEKWIADQGFVISRSALQRYGKDFERKIEAVRLASEQARSLQLAAPDREGALTDALCRLVQERMFALLVDSHGLADDDLPKIARAVADLGRAAVSQKRWREEMAERLEREKQSADEKLGEVVRRNGLSPEVARFGMDSVGSMENGRLTRIRVGIEEIDLRDSRRAWLKQVREIERARDQVVVLLTENHYGWRTARAIREFVTHGATAAWEQRELREALRTCLRQNDLHEGNLPGALDRVQQACCGILAIASDKSAELEGWPLEALCGAANRLSLICFCVAAAPMAPREEYDALIASATTVCALVRANLESGEEGEEPKDK